MKIADALMKLGGMLIEASQNIENGLFRIAHAIEELAKREDR
jgi:hypothetical protein